MLQYFFHCMCNCVHSKYYFGFWYCTDTHTIQRTKTRIGYKSSIQNENILGIVATFALLVFYCCCISSSLCTARALHVQALKMQNFKLVIWKFAAITIEYRCTYNTMQCRRQQNATSASLDCANTADIPSLYFSSPLVSIDQTTQFSIKSCWIIQTGDYFQFSVQI